MKTIMIIDDEPDIAKKIQAYLQDDDLNIIKADNSKQALGIIDDKKDDINLILIDTQMPGSKKAALFSMNPNTKMDISNIEDFLQKPFTKEDLIDFVKKSFKKNEEL